MLITPHLIQNQPYYLLAAFHARQLPNPLISLAPSSAIGSQINAVTQLPSASCAWPEAQGRGYAGEEAAEGVGG